MSGAHDQARDAAQRLYRALKRGGFGRIRDWRDEVETIAEYLGVKEDK